MSFRSNPELISLTVDNDVVVGSSEAGVLGDSVSILVDGRAWAVVPSTLLPNQRGRAFRCDLPPVGNGMDGAGHVSVADVFGEPIATAAIPPRTGRLNPAGLQAFRMLAFWDRPFFAVPYMSFDGAVVTISGSHLPPGGDPSSLSVEFGEGVAFQVRYPLASPEWEAHFWYWPNAGMSGIQIAIDLASSEARSNPFTFRFRYREEVSRCLEPHGRVWLPSDLGITVGLPTNPSQLTRVQTWSDARSVTFTGYNHFRVIENIFAKHGVFPKKRPTVLDWGCGYGRVTRHAIKNWRDATIIGMDIDAQNISWASANLPRGHFIQTALLPPCPLRDHSVDAVFSVSVMTHLAPEVQQVWLKELSRVVRRNGIVLMTFQGPGAAVWSSIWHDALWFEAFERDGVHASRVDPALHGNIPDDGYYRNVTQTHDYVRREWTEYFELVEILDGAIGYLDVAVLRHR